jgi:hypothetical protein
MGLTPYIGDNPRRYWYQHCLEIFVGGDNHFADSVKI